MFGLAPVELLMLEDELNRTQDPLMRTSLLGRIETDRDPLGAREAIRIVCDRYEARRLLWSLEIAASAISSSEEWADVQARYRISLEKPVVINYADPIGWQFGRSLRGVQLIRRRRYMYLNLSTRSGSRRR